MDDDFSGGIDQFWTREVRLDGYGWVYLFRLTQSQDLANI
jgi:hypothetical protein